MSRVLLVSTDIIGSTMAGPGIRAWELARALASDHTVTLAAPNSSDLAPDGFRLAVYPAAGSSNILRELIEQSDVIITQGLVVEQYPELLTHQRPLAIDLYDPMLLEGIDMFAESERGTAQAQFERYSALNELQLRRGDFFFCATERQRDYWLGALTAAGRITPELVSSSDRELRDLIDLVPSGLPPAPPAPQPPALRGSHPAIGPDDVVMLWAGGLWDWFEPDLLIRAMAELSVERPRFKLVFFAGARPTTEGAPFRTRTHLRAQNLAAELEVLGRTVIFIEEWVPYERRAAFLREADIGVSAHRPGVETRFAFRTRLLDYIWAELPVIASAGDSLGEEIAQAGQGLLVAPGDLAGWVTALRRLGDDPAARARCRAVARTIAQRYTWQEVARPLARFCARPRRTATSLSAAVGRLAELEQTLRERDAYIAHVENQYQRAVDQARALDQAIKAAPSTQVSSLARRMATRIRMALPGRSKRK